MTARPDDETRDDDSQETKEDAKRQAAREEIRSIYEALTQRAFFDAWLSGRGRF